MVIFYILLLIELFCVLICNTNIIINKKIWRKQINANKLYKPIFQK